MGFHCDESLCRCIKDEERYCNNTIVIHNSHLRTMRPPMFNSYISCLCLCLHAARNNNLSGDTYMYDVYEDLPGEVTDGRNTGTHINFILMCSIVAVCSFVSVVLLSIFCCTCRLRLLPIIYLCGR